MLKGGSVAVRARGCLPPVSPRSFPLPALPVPHSELTTMSRNNWLAMLGVVLLAAGACRQFAAAKESDTVAATTATTATSADNSPATDPAGQEPADDEAAAADKNAADDSGPAPVDLFQAMDDGQAEVTFIAKNDHAGRVILTNKTKQPLNLRLPEAFAGVPVLAQFGGGGGGNRGGGGRGGFGGGGNTGGQQQAVGGGGGGGGGGGQVAAAAAASSAFRPNKPGRSTWPSSASTTACAIRLRRSRTRWCRPPTRSTIRR